MKRSYVGLLAVPFIVASFIIVASSAEAFGPGGMRGPMRGGMRGPGMGGPFADEITVESVKLSNGIQTTITTDNKDILERLQNPPGNRLEGRDNDLVSHEVEELSNGIRITVTSDDEDVVEHLHERADREAKMNSITHTVTNISNGVQIEITSDDPDAVEHIQSREHPGQGRGPGNDDVDFSVEELSNGVRITITSDDSDVVERIQKKSENNGKGQGMHGGRKGRGMGKMRGGFGRFEE